ncbi:MAG: hypothetical protein HC828_22685 [Blastochloris sp.]|nr:hypothetical protein [Blastochloris sp.]
MDTAPRTYPTLHTAYLVLLALVALLPRLLDLGGFVTLDEINFWMGRAERFLNALQTGDFAATAISTHSRRDDHVAGQCGHPAAAGTGSA